LYAQVASEKAKPNIEYENNWFFNEGFLATPTIKHPNTIPIPTPAPARPIVANPAPISFDDSNVTKKYYKQFINEHLIYKLFTNI